MAQLIIYNNFLLIFPNTGLKTPKDAILGLLQDRYHMSWWFYCYIQQGVVYEYQWYVNLYRADIHWSCWSWGLLLNILQSHHSRRLKDLNLKIAQVDQKAIVWSITEEDNPLTVFSTIKSLIPTTYHLRIKHYILIHITCQISILNESSQKFWGLSLWMSNPKRL